VSAVSGRVLVVDDSRTVRRAAERALTEAGYEVVLAADGREGLEQSQKARPDLVLVDLAMPHMDGVEFCGALRAVDNLRDLPIVLMSARSELFDDAVMQKTGAMDAISKPFSPEALLAVTAHALRRLTLGRRTSAPGTLGASESDSDGDTEGTEPERLNYPPPDRGPTSLSGRIEDVPLGELLQLLQFQRQTGVLDIERGRRIVGIGLREGLVDIAVGKNGEPEYLLGRYLIEEELIEADELEALTRQRESPRLLGAQLVKLGYITQEDLHRALVRQTSELVYEVLRWKSGVYRYYRFARLPQVSEERLGLPIATILLEGLRRVDEWRLVEEQIQGFDQILVPRHEAIGSVSRDDMSREERTVLAAIDGKRTIRELVEHTRMSSFDVCKILFQLLTSGLVRPMTGA